MRMSKDKHTGHITLIMFHIFAQSPSFNNKTSAWLSLKVNLTLFLIPIIWVAIFLLHAKALIFATCRPWNFYYSYINFQKVKYAFLGLILASANAANIPLEKCHLLYDILPPLALWPNDLYHSLNTSYFGDHSWITYYVSFSILSSNCIALYVISSPGMYVLFVGLFYSVIKPKELIISYWIVSILLLN